MAEPLQYLLISVKVVALEKISFGDKQNPKVVVKTLTVNDKHYLLNRGNLAQPIQMQLSEKQKNFCEFFFAFLICILNFKHLPNKDNLHT